MQASLRVRLAPFSEQEVQHLIESMAGPLPTEAEVVSGFPRAARLWRPPCCTGWSSRVRWWPSQRARRIEPLALADLPSSAHAAGFLSRRIELLPQETIDLMTIGAGGKRVQSETGCKTVREIPDQAAAILEEACAPALRWMQAEGTNVRSSTIRYARPCCPG